MLLRNAFSALGNIGARVMNAGGRFGRNVSTRADRDIRNTDMYKNAQERRAENRVRFRAGVDRNGNEIELGRFGRFVRGGERNVARARAQYLKNLEMRSREENMMGTGFESAMAGVETKAGSQMVSDYESLISNGKAQLEGDAGVVNVNDMESVGTQDVGRDLGEHLGVVAAVVGDANPDVIFVDILEDIVRKTLGGHSNGISVHPVGPDTHQPAQSARAEFQCLVECVLETCRIVVPQFEDFHLGLGVEITVQPFFRCGDVVLCHKPRNSRLYQLRTGRLPS